MCSCGVCMCMVCVMAVFHSLQRNVLRIALQSLGSPLWLDDGGSWDPSSPSPPPPLTLTQFLHSLRALLRRAYGVAMVTIPTHLMQVNRYSITLKLIHGHFPRHKKQLCNHFWDRLPFYVQCFCTYLSIRTYCV